MKGLFPIEKFQQLTTPFYYYDTTLLQDTLAALNNRAKVYNYHVHYAVKANANRRILEIIREAGLGIDCVSGGEIEAALAAGFEGNQIAFAGVGKADWEINLGLENNIFCFNVESEPELEVINELAAAKGKVASIALRINPEVDAHTHHYITTGLKENKFGINLALLDRVLEKVAALPAVKLIGLHFHIGSQITINKPFELLSKRINEIQEQVEAKGFSLQIINVGGGLGIDYENPNENPIPNFDDYFDTFHQHLQLRPHQQLHFELGRAVVCQCGSLITRVLYVKEGVDKKFIIADAGMTELIRPALYEAHHNIENISSNKAVERYDVVGPICESSDCFGKEELLNASQRGDLLALRSAGAYGEIMASQYNCRTLPKAYYSDEL